MKTKKALKSWELWTLFLYALVEYLPKLFNDPIFQQIMHDEMYWITPLFMLVMAGLRIFKTKQGISFDHWKPKQPPNDHPQTSDSIIADELRNEERDRGLY